MRALIDQGSEVTIITENASQLLKLKTINTNWPLSGIGNTPAGSIRHVVNLDIRSMHKSEFALHATALVLKTITGLIQRSTCIAGNWPHIESLNLADPSFGTPASIDVLLGADVYKRIIMPGVLHGADDAPVAQETVFGWVLSDEVSSHSHDITRVHVSTHHSCIDIDARLKTFWEIEELPNNKPYHTDDEI